jgi:hypothetical protein
LAEQPKELDYAIPLHRGSSIQIFELNLLPTRASLHKNHEKTSRKPKMEIAQEALQNRGAHPLDSSFIQKKSFGLAPKFALNTHVQEVSLKNTAIAVEIQTAQERERDIPHDASARKSSGSLG